MSTVKVCFAPGADKALVYESQKICWLIDLEKEVPEREPAPQMHNLHIDDWYQEKDMKDEFPYLNVRKELVLLAHRHSTIFMILYSCDVGFSLEFRKECPGLVGEHLREPGMLEFLKAMFLLPKEADIQEEVVAEMREPLQALVREAVKKWRD